MTYGIQRSNTARNTIVFLVVLIVAFLLDGLAGARTHNALIYRGAQVFSATGNGVFLFGASFVLLIYGFIKKNVLLKSGALLSVASTGLSGIVVNVLKAVFERPRIEYLPDAVTTLLNSPSLYHTNGHFSSFPSGHTTASFAAAYAFSTTYPKYRIPLFLAATLVAISRVVLGKHYPSDVVAGAALGIFVAWLVISKSEMPYRWKHYALALLVIFVSFFKLGGYLVFDLDEAIYAESAREMLNLGDLLTPMYNFKPMFEKPPMLYWMMMAGYKLMGVTEFAARVFEALSGAFLAWMTFEFVRRLRGARAAALAVVALVLNIEYFVYTHAAITDMTLALCFAGALYSFYIGVHESTDRKIPRRWFMAFWVFCALGVLTKGVIGLALPLGVAFWYLILAARARFFKPLFHPINVMLFMLAAGPWFAAEFYYNGQEFYEVFIVTHHIKRFTGALSGHGGPFYYYLPVLIIGFFPWIAFVPDAIRRAYAQFRERSGGLYLFSAIWLVIIFGFFSAASTKLPNYIVPVLPPVAVMASLSIFDCAGARLSRLSVWIMALLSLAIGVGLIVTSYTGVKTGVAEMPAEFYNSMLSLVFKLGVFFIVIFIFAYASRRFARAGLALTSITVFVLLIFLRLAVVPPVNIYMQRALYDYALYLKALPTEVNVATYRINRPSVVFYAQRKITEYDEKSVDGLVSGGNLKTVLITDKKHYPELARFGLTTIAEDHEFMLLTNGKGLPAMK